MGRDFNYFPERKVPVIVYSPDDFLGGAHTGIRALYDGKIRIPAYTRDMNITEFKSLVRHEFTHAVIFDLSAGKCPRWFNEGLAQYQEDKVKKIDLKVLPSFMKKKEFIAFEKIFDRNDFQQVHLGLFYEQSFSMTKYLLKRYQLYKLKNVLLDLAAGKSMEIAFNDNLYLTVKDFESRWFKWAENQK